jgi:hypothetical protein
MNDIDFQLMFRLIKENNLEIKAIRNEMREGFASLRTHNQANVSDITHLQSRIDYLELQLERISSAVGLSPAD